MRAIKLTLRIILIIVFNQAMSQGFDMTKDSTQSRLKSLGTDSVKCNCLIVPYKPKPECVKICWGASLNKGGQKTVSLLEKYVPESLDKIAHFNEQVRLFAPTNYIPTLDDYSLVLSLDEIERIQRIELDPFQLDVVVPRNCKVFDKKVRNRFYSDLVKSYDFYSEEFSEEFYQKVVKASLEIFKSKNYIAADSLMSNEFYKSLKPSRMPNSRQGKLVSILSLENQYRVFYMINVEKDESLANMDIRKVVSGSFPYTADIPLVGEIYLVNSDFEGAEITLEMEGLYVSNLQDEYKSKLEGHLKSADFFGVETFPTSTLEVKEITGREKDKYQVKCNLTIKSITREVDLEMDVTMTNGRFVGLASFTVDRSKFEVKYGSGSFFDNLGDSALSDDLEIQLKIVGYERALAKN